MHRDESLARSNVIDSICDQFEKQCLAGALPQIEDVLAKHTEVDRTRLLRELLLIDLEIRRTNGETPTAADYATRFPGQTDVIDAALQTIATRVTNPDGAETVDVSFSSADETYVPSDPAEAETIAPGSQTKPDQPSSSEPGSKRFGDYELLHEIARGGMGVVYKARQTKLNRIVALKMIKAGELAGDEEIQRFHAEAEAAAALDHPGIVPIYEVGEQDGQHFFSMGFIEGAGLDSRLKDGPLPPKEAAELIKTISDAVQYAHEKGIVHRDLKPANVLIDADGKPKITDFGLAKNISGDSGMTATGQVLGTPSYMPPEQAAGKVEEIGPLADVYALGAMLYATLTGRPPFQAANVMETLVQVLEREPVSPQTLNPAVDKDLETIVLKCLEKDAAKRYSSARTLVDELGRFLENKPILARPVGRLVRGWRWCKRNPLGATVAVLALVIAIGSPILAAIQFDLRKEADGNLDLANNNLDLANDNAKKFKRAKDLADRKVIELGESLVRETAEKKRANQNLVRADDVVQKFVTEVAKEGGPLSNFPGTQPVRMKLLQMGRKYYEQLIADNPDARLSPRQAEAYFNLAGIMAQLPGGKTKAVQLYQQAAMIEEQLSREHPEDPRYSSRLVARYNNLSNLYWDTGHTKKALEANLRALTLSKTLARKNRTNTSYQFFLANCHHTRGHIYSNTGLMTSALTEFKHALALLESLLRKLPNDEQSQQLFVLTLQHIGGVYHETGKTNDAVHTYERAITACKQLARAKPHIQLNHQSLATTLNSLGIAYRSTGQYPAAMRSYRSALSIAVRLTKENASVPDYKALSGAIHHNIGSLLVSTGQSAQALAEYNQSITIAAELTKQNPKVHLFKTHLHTRHSDLGRVYQSLGRPEEALREFQSALQLSIRLANENPKIRLFRFEGG